VDLSHSGYGLGAESDEHGNELVTS